MLKFYTEELSILVFYRTHLNTTGIAQAVDVLMAMKLIKIEIVWHYGTFLKMQLKITKAHSQIYTCKADTADLGGLMNQCTATLTVINIALLMMI